MFVSVSGCPNCALPITDDNWPQDGEVWAYSPTTQFTSEFLEGCMTCVRRAAVESARLFLDHNAPEDAMGVLADALGIATSKKV